MDREKVGTTPLVRLPIAPGPHVIELRSSKGAAVRKLSVVVRPGVETKQSVIFD